MKSVSHLANMKIINELRLTRVLLLVGLFLLISVKGRGQTATITGTTTVCKDASRPRIVFKGENGTSPYTFTYHINLNGDLTVSTTTGDTVSVAVETGSSNTFTFYLTSVTDNNSNTASVAGEAIITVNPLPAAITGNLNVCAGSFTTLSCATGGGTFSSGTPSTATVDAVTGIVTGVLSGTAIITYTLGTGCLVTTLVTVNPLPSTSAIYHQ